MNSLGGKVGSYSNLNKSMNKSGGGSYSGYRGSKTAGWAAGGGSGGQQKAGDGPVPKRMKNRHKIASIDQSGSLGVRPQRCGRERNLGLCILHFSKFVTRESTHLITLSRTFAVARRLDRALAHDALDVPRVGSAVRSRHGLERWMIVANHKRWRLERCSFHPSLAAAMSRFRAATRARSVTRRERFRELPF